MTYSSHTPFSWFAALAILLSSILAGTAQAAPNELLGPGDGIRVTVFQNPDLTTDARISPEGTLRMPLIGVVTLAGRSVEDAAQFIAQRFREGDFLKDPEVVVSLLQIRSRQVSVLGQVARPGRYPLDDVSNQLIDVLALAGGIAPGGDEKIVVLTRRNGEPVKHVIDAASLLAGTNPSANIQMENGDTIYVQRAPVFYIYGEVQRPGAYRLEDNLNIMQAMSLGGGITRRGTERGIRIHRHGNNGDLVKVEAKPYDKVQADDVIYVNESLF